MQKLDFKKADKSLYTGKAGRFDVLEVRELTFLAIDGEGDPNASADYTHAIAALYGVSYALKFHCKKALERDHVVPPLEGLWWAKDMSSFQRREKSAWKWRMMIRQPEWVTADMFDNILEVVVIKNAKKKDAATNEATLRKLRLIKFEEGQVVQTLHIGSYDAEGPVLKEMHEQFIPENGFEFAGLHHEIYLGDPRKVAPEKLKTILRQPVSKKP